MTWTFDLSRSLKVKSVGGIGLAIYGFLIMVNSQIGTNLAPLRDTYRLWNQCDVDFDLSWSIKVKSDGVTGVAIYGFLLMVNRNIGPNSAPLCDIRLWNPSDLDFDLSRSRRSKVMVSLESPYMVSYWWLTVTYKTLLRSFARFVLSRWLSLIIGPKFMTPPPTHTHTHQPLPQGDFSQNLVMSSLGQREGCHQKWIWLVK